MICEQPEFLHEIRISKMEILIVDASLGGLAAACCFARDRHHIQEGRPSFESGFRLTVATGF